MKRATLNHPKTYALMAALKISRREALGLLTLLWDFTGQYAPDGSIGRFTNSVIASAVEWDTERSDEMVGHLVRTGWLDEMDDQNVRLLVHDWADHCESWVKKRLQREKREFVQYVRPKRTTIVDDQRTTVPGDHSGRPLPPFPSPPQPAPNQAKPAPIKAGTVEAIYQAYPKKVGKIAALNEIKSAIKIVTDRGQDSDWLLERVKVFAKSDAGNAGTYTLHPNRWFKNGRYDDDEAEWSRDETGAQGVSSVSEEEQAAISAAHEQAMREVWERDE